MFIVTYRAVIEGKEVEGTEVEGTEETEQASTRRLGDAEGSENFRLVDWGRRTPSRCHRATRGERSIRAPRVQATLCFLGGLYPWRV